MFEAPPGASCSKHVSATSKSTGETLQRSIVVKTNPGNAFLTAAVRIREYPGHVIVSLVRPPCPFESRAIPKR